MRGKLHSLGRRVSALEGDGYGLDEIAPALSHYAATGQLPDSPKLAVYIKELSDKLEEADALMNASVCGFGDDLGININPDSQEG